MTLKNSIFVDKSVLHNTVVLFKKKITKQAHKVRKVLIEVALLYVLTKKTPESNNKIALEQKKSLITLRKRQQCAGEKKCLMRN